MGIVELIWLFFLLSSLQPLMSQRVLAYQRLHALRQLERLNGSRGITLIHRRETFNLLGIPFGGFIDVDDSEEVIRAIEMTSDDIPIDLVIHTPGGLVLAAEQIARALAAHPARVTVYVPHYAMSGGTLVALAADSIVLAPSAVMGPVDPQLGEHPAASVLSVVEKKDVNEIDDRTLILADLATKAQIQVRASVARLLEPHLPPEKVAQVTEALTDGRWTHDYPIDVETARSLGLVVSSELPDQIRELMRYYPQPRGRRPSVEYVPVPYRDVGGGEPPAGQGVRRFRPGRESPEARERSGSWRLPGGRTEAGPK